MSAAYLGYTSLSFRQETNPKSRVKTLHIPGIHLVVLQAVFQGRDNSVGGGAEGSQASKGSRLGGSVLGLLQLGGPHPVGLQQAGAGQALPMGVQLHPYHGWPIRSCRAV